jgi:uncharacterized protein (DUF4415 family)
VLLLLVAHTVRFEGDDEVIRISARRAERQERKRYEKVTVHLDADIIAWLQAEGKGYQTRLNHLLRSAMLQELTGKS